MLLQCPRCRTRIRLAGFHSERRVLPYWCQGCRDVVRLDLDLDEIPSSSSSGSFRKQERRQAVLVADRPGPDLAAALDALRRGGFLAESATDVDGALERIRRSHPDLVLAAARLPGGGALELLKQMRRDPRLAGTPVAALGGRYEERLVDRLHRERAQGWIPRQCLRDTLVFRARRMLEATPVR